MAREEGDPTAFEPVPHPVGVRDLARIVRVATLAALAVVGRVAFLWAPNIALTYFVVFMAGVLEGALAGALVGLLAMTVTNIALSGLHPVLAANGLAMALLGVAGGLMRPLLLRPVRDRTDVALRATTLGTVGFFGTLLFSVAADVVGFFLQFMVTPEGSAIGVQALAPMLLAGLVFNLVPALVNAAMFVVLTPALLYALAKSGHLRPLADKASAGPV